MATAIVKTSAHGTHVRLSNYGYPFGTIPLAVQPGEKPTEAAEHALAEYGYTVTTPWKTDNLSEWVAEIDLTKEP